MNLATVIVLLVVAGLVIVALVSLHKGKGRCTCGGKSSLHCSSCSSCAHCPIKNNPAKIKTIVAGFLIFSVL